MWFSKTIPTQGPLTSIFQGFQSYHMAFISRESILSCCGGEFAALLLQYLNMMWCYRLIRWALWMLFFRSPSIYEDAQKTNKQKATCYTFTTCQTQSPIGTFQCEIINKIWTCSAQFTDIIWHHFCISVFPKCKQLPLSLDTSVQTLHSAAEA